jgi:Xaa-Pro aminopeptidase
VPYPVDVAKLERVRALMEEHDLDALIVRAVDNVVYLASFWPMKGHELLVFPREGPQTLVVMDAQLGDAQRESWADDVRTFPFYDERDPRPPAVRSLDVCLDLLRGRGFERLGIELSHAAQAADRMVGEPTLPTHAFFAALSGAAGETVDAAPLLAAVRMVKTEQERERMRRANALARLGLEHVRERLRPGMRTSEVAALFEAYVHTVGVGFEGRVASARAFAIVWSGRTIAPFTVTPDWYVEEGAPTLMEIWVAADGYWTDLGKNLAPGPLDGEYERVFDLLLPIFDEASEMLRDGADLPELDRLVRARIAAAGYPGQPAFPLAHGVGARPHEPPFAHQAGVGTARSGMVIAVEPGIYWDGGGVRLEDDFLVGENGAEKLCGFPEDPRRADDATAEGGWR